MVEAAEHFEGTVRVHATQVLCGDERTAGHIGQVDDIDASGPAQGHGGQGVVHLTHVHAHPRWAAVQAFTCAPRLG